MTRNQKINEMWRIRSRLAKLTPDWLYVLGYMDGLRDTCERSRYSALPVYKQGYTDGQGDRDVYTS